VRLVVFLGVVLVPAQALALPCVPDADLARAAAALVANDEPLSPGAIARAAREAGSDAPRVHALRDGEGDDARVGEWLARIAERYDAPIACGEAWSEEGRLVLARARAGSLTIERAPPGEDEEAVLRLRGELAAGFSSPELVARSADGTLSRWGVSPDELREGVTLSDLVELPALVQLVARGPHGPLPIAERIAAAPGDDASASLRGLPGGNDLGTRVAALREAHGASALRRNRLLAAEAMRHARNVCDAGRVAHTLAPDGDPERRLSRAGIHARVVGEVGARAASPAAAMDALAESPSHRYTLADRRFTDTGLGEATDDTGKTCVVVLLAAWPRYVGR
jgi:hypothetical protein